MATAVASSAGENEEIIGDVKSTVIDNAEEGEEVLPAASVAIAVRE